MNKKSARQGLVENFIRQCNGSLEVWEQVNHPEVLPKKYIDTEIKNQEDQFKIKFKIIFTEKEIAQIKFKLGDRLCKVAEKSVALQGEKVKRWLATKDIDWALWKSYRTLLASEGKSKDVILDNENVIDNCIDMAGDPSRDGSWESRGLVMGNVQSGKTLNYIGLINKAMDAGYKVVIVLGGHLNELRQQSQERIDEGAIGRDSSKFGKQKGGGIIPSAAPFGVGRHDGLTGRPHGGTTVHSDFGKKAAESLNINLASNDPVIFVIKKHHKILDNLIDWIDDFEDPRVKNKPMLLIDDEADYATIP